MRSLEDLHRFPYSLRHRLLIKLKQPETEIISFTKKLHVQTANNPRSLQSHAENQ
jgi:hypothetical protein